MKLTAKAESLYRLQRYGGDGPALEGVERIELRRFADLSGAMIELMRLDGEGRSLGLEGFRPAQVNHSRVQPGTIKAFHLHRRQTDVWFVPPEDRVLVALVDLREGSPSAERVTRMLLGDARPALLRIPPGVAHGCRNLGAAPATIVYFTDLHFSPDPAECDEGRLPWDLVGAEIWDVPRD